MMLWAMHARLQPAETLAGIRRAHRGFAHPGVAAAEALPMATHHSARLDDDLGRAGGAACRAARQRPRGAGQIVPGAARGPRFAPRQDGIVDPTFAAIVERARLSWRVLGAGDEAELADLLGSRAIDPVDAPRPPRAIARRR